MKVAILGFGLQGKSSFAYWSKDPASEITICDEKPDKKMPAGVKTKLGDDYLKGLARFDVIVRSPSVHPNDIAQANSPGILDKVTTNTNEFFRVCPTKNIIGVTGTKGKGTTSSLIERMLAVAFASQRRVHLGGNIGTPPLDLLTPSVGGGVSPDDWVILELANFQLIDLKYSPKIAVCLMVAAEHMDWHKDLSEYITAKQQLFRHQNKDTDTAIYYAHNANSEHIVSVSPAYKLPYMSPPGADVIEDYVTIEGKQICHVDDIKLLGKHNWQNICAAVTAVWQITQNVEANRSVITSFGGLEHRLQLVREIDGVKYYDDSFGTTPETAIVAIEAFNSPKIVILGGSDKGASYDELADAVMENEVKAVVVIGDTAPDISSVLRNKGYKNIVQGSDTMSEIVAQAKDASRPGDVVLLSTGCASFGLFKNYQDRGEQFTRAVQSI